jgi:glycosyltransferase involved in cell wall biosynthesis
MVKSLKVSVAIVTYRRAWALPYSLTSLVNQTRRSDEVVVVLKPSGDGSEEVISRFSSSLPIKLVIQREGFVVQAYQMAIDNASGDIILFLDDDAVAEERWIEKYIELFEELLNVAGIGGTVYTAYFNNSVLLKAREHFLPMKPPRNVFYRKPLPELSDYVHWLSIAGFRGFKQVPEEGVFKSIGLSGANMGFKSEAIADCPIAELYRRSRKGYLFEQVLAYCARKKGFNIYEVKGSRAPIVWHIMHSQSLTRSKGFWHEFWLHYDRLATFWRLKKLGAKMSLLAYLVGSIIMLRKETLPRLLATIYAWIVRC